MKIPTTLLILAATAAACSNAQQFTTARAFPNLQFSNPVGLYAPGDGSNRLFLVQQPGRIRVFENSQSTQSAGTFLDISRRITSGGEMGLLGLAFDPDYRNNGYFYLDYTRTVQQGNENQLQTVISRMRVRQDNPLEADTTSEMVLLVIDQPYQNHNGGQIAFGPDGYLYIGMGDGGSGGDPQGHGQNRASLLGKILRIDVHKTSGNLQYAIPESNPFAGNTAGYREEIYAYGLRNPWRFSFDVPTGRLWAGDVGQGAWEEVDIIESGQNHGWNVMEGFHCYRPSSGCDTTGKTKPVWEYPHDTSGGQSITGGFVYRGPSLPSLTGRYIYGDFASGKIWALAYEPGQPATNTVLVRTSTTISSFGVDAAGELYFCSFDGRIYKIVQTSGVGPDDAPMASSITRVTPNPSANRAQLAYSVARHEHVTITLHDMMGRMVATLVDGMQEMGQHSVMIDAAALPGAMYVCRLTAGEAVSSMPVVLAR